MQKLCDLYVPILHNSAELKFLKIYDKNFNYNSEVTYQGYLGVNVSRIKLVMFVIRFRVNNINCYNVPIEYRDNLKISEDQALKYACEYSNSRGFSVRVSSISSTPLYWDFEIVNDPLLERVGGKVTVDKLDGHIWTQDELDEYMYDYNNIL